MTTETATAKSTRRMILTRHSSQYWRVTLDHPPLNIFGPESIPQLNEVVTALETDKQVKVVVFDSAVEGFFLTHYDFVAKPEETTRPSGANRVAATARYARAPEPGASCVDRVDPRTCDWCRK